MNTGGTAVVCTVIITYFGLVMVKEIVWYIYHPKPAVHNHNSKSGFIMDSIVLTLLLLIIFCLLRFLYVFLHIITTYLIFSKMKQILKGIKLVS